MLSLNKVMVTGRLTRDPETKYLPSGMAVTSIAIAVNRRFLDSKTNEWKDETTYLDVETWGKMAERLAETLTKGKPVFVEGRLKTDSWERDGQKHSKLKVVADRVSPFEVPSRGQDGGEEGGGSGAPARKPNQGSQRSGGTASDNLEFSNGGTEDDIPF